MIAIILFPQLPIFLINILPESHFLYSFFHFSLFLNGTPILFSVNSGILFLMQLFMFIYFVIDLIIKETNININEKSKILPNSYRFLVNVNLAYRIIQFCIQLLNSFLGKYIVPIHYLNAQLILLCSYLLIAKKGLPMTIQILFILSVTSIIGVWGLFLFIAGRVFQKSRKTITSWRDCYKHGLDFKYFMKFKRSARPVAIEFPGYFKITNKTLLVYFKSITRGVFRVLLTMKAQPLYK